MLVPAMALTLIPASSSALIIPICASPRAPPPLKASPTTGSLSGTFCSSPYGSLAVFVFSWIETLSCAYIYKPCNRNNAISIFLNKFTLQNYEKEFKEGVVPADSNVYFITFGLSVELLIAVLQRPSFSA